MAGWRDGGMAGWRDGGMAGDWVLGHVEVSLRLHATLAYTVGCVANGESRVGGAW